MGLACLVNLFIYKLPTAPPAQGCNLLKLSIPCETVPGRQTSQGTFLVLPFGELPPPVCQAWPPGSRNKLGLEPALEVSLLV